MGEREVLGCMCVEERLLKGTEGREHIQAKRNSRNSQCRTLVFDSQPPEW